MISKHLRILTLVLFGGTAGYSQTTLNVSASRGIGHPQLLPNNQVSTGNPNLVEGRELFSPKAWRWTHRLALRRSTSATLAITGSWAGRTPPISPTASRPTW